MNFDETGEIILIETEEEFFERNNFKKITEIGEIIDYEYDNNLVQFENIKKETICFEKISGYVFVFKNCEFENFKIKNKELFKFYVVFENSKVKNIYSEGNISYKF